MRHFFKSICMAAIVCSCSAPQEQNPFYVESTAPFGLPMFDQINASHYMPAFKKGMADNNLEIEAIVNNPETPNFKNTVEALEFSGALLKKVGGVFFNLTGSDTNDSLKAIQNELTPLMSAHDDNIMLNDALFQRVKTVYDNRASENLTAEQAMVLEKYYKNFVRSGAMLSAEEKEELKRLNSELSLLSIKFADNLLAENNAYKLVITDKAQLSGLPDWAVAAAAAEAGEEGKWVFTLSGPSMIPFLQYADARELREEIYKAYTSRGDNNNDKDNKDNIAKILELRQQKAQLLGFDSYAQFALDDRMAKNSDNVYDLLNNIWESALPKAKEEAKDLQALINKEGGNFDLEAWDWWYYTEKLRKERYNLDESEIKPYFAINNVLDGAFMVANNLWGIEFVELTDVPVYNEEVRAFQVKDKDGSHIGIFYVDFFPRASKRGGAWMSDFVGHTIQDGKETTPVIVNVCNFTKPVGDTPALLTIDEVQTLFHEFGHALHGLLTEAAYPSVSGTSVARDFVELPSQIMEHWSTHPDVLKLYAKHYQTGEVIPEALVAKMNEAANFNTGFTTTELVAAALLDMDYHTATDLSDFNAHDFEQKTTERIGLIDEIAYRYRGPYFAHIFAGGYATGYYSYLWAEVLDADAFDAFLENGLFDQKTAALYRENILEKGGSVDPMTLYVNFRGHEPNADALLRGRGLK